MFRRSSAPDHGEVQTRVLLATGLPDVADVVGRLLHLSGYVVIHAATHEEVFRHLLAEPSRYVLVWPPLRTGVPPADAEIRRLVPGAVVANVDDVNADGIPELFRALALERERAAPVQPHDLLAWQNMRRAMEMTHGNKSAAARLVGVPLRTFQRRWEKLRPR